MVSVAWAPAMLAQNAWGGPGEGLFQPAPELRRQFLPYISVMKAPDQMFLVL